MSYPVDFLAKTLAGKGFQVQRRLTISGSSTLYLVLDLSQTTDKCIFGMPIVAGSTSGYAHLDTYSCDSYTAGTEYEVNALNPCRGTNEAPMYEATGISGQYHLREYAIGTESTNQNSGGGFVTNDETKILDSSKPLVFKFENQEDSEIEVSFGYVWYECPKQS